MTTTAPQVIIIAGPNGAGKTTFAREFLPQEAHCPVVVNADHFARTRKQCMTPEATLNPTPDPALAALAALQRAGLRAAQEALRTNTYLVVGRDEKIEHVSPQDYLRDRAVVGTRAA